MPQGICTVRGDFERSYPTSVVRLRLGVNTVTGRNLVDNLFQQGRTSQVFVYRGLSVTMVIEAAALTSKREESI